MSTKARNANKRPQRWGSNSSLGPPMGGSRPSSPAVSNPQPSNGQSQASSVTKPSSSEVAEVNKHMHDRLIFLITSLVGTKVVATLKGGARFEGILSSATTEGELGICLKLPYDLAQPEAALPRTMLIFGKDLQEITSADIDFEEKVEEVKVFKTDADISNGVERKEKELQKWSEVMEDFDATTGVLESWDRPTNKPWDQFETNENLFGTTTNYDEEIYTTKLDRNTANFKERERKAERLANEILSGTSSNPHIAEERGHQAPTEGLDEEAKYGAVIRGPNAYIPPAARKAAAASATLTSASASPKVTTAAQPLVAHSNGNAPAPPSVASIPEVNIVPARVPERERVIPSVSTRLPMPTITTSSPSEEGAVSAGSASGEKNKQGTLAVDFRRFVTSEKERLVQKKQALAKKEKSDKLADLKNFSQSFKLKTPLPADLAQIIKKKDESVGDSKPKNSTTTIETTPAKPLPPANSAINKLKASLGPIPQIPPFNPNRSKAPTAPSTAASPPATSTASTSAKPTSHPAPNHPAASVADKGITSHQQQFKPNPNASTFTPLNGHASSSSPSAVSNNLVDSGPNPFFGDRSLKKGGSIFVKEEFSPFKNGTLQDPTSVSWIWPFGTKSYKALYPFASSEIDEQSLPPPNALPQHQPMPYAFPYHQPQFRPGQSPQHPQAMHPHMAAQPPMYPGFVPMPFAAPVSMAQTHGMTAAAVPGVYSPQMGAMVPPGAIHMPGVYGAGRPMPPHAYAYPTGPVHHFSPADSRMMHPPTHYVE